jgi:hypothetical protein
VHRVRRAGSRPRVLRAELLTAHVVALVLTLAAAAVPQATLPPSIVDLDAAARSAGNRKAEAEQLARVLLVHTWPAQILKVRVDGFGSHAVAGLVLSGVKFHGPLDEGGFLREVAALVERTFSAASVEEVDVWTTVPISVGKGAVVAGDFAQPTTRIVFSATLRRADAATGLLPKLERGHGVFWDAAWRATLRAAYAPARS